MHDIKGETLYKKIIYLEKENLLSYSSLLDNLGLIMALSNANVVKIAKLARIACMDDEIAKNVDELNNIFQWIEQLSEVDTDGVPPMAGVGGYTLRTRADVITDGNIKDDVITNAPNTAYDCYVVPKVVE